MEIYPHKIEVKVMLELSGRELELLDNLVSYDNKKWVESICPNSYNGGVSQKQMLEFLASLKRVASDALANVNSTVKNGLLRD